jgi:hypothetical protein
MKLGGLQEVADRERTLAKRRPVSVKLALFLVTLDRRRALHLCSVCFFSCALTLHPAWPARHLFVVLF